MEQANATSLDECKAYWQSSVTIALVQTTHKWYISENYRKTRPTVLTLISCQHLFWWALEVMVHFVAVHPSNCTQSVTNGAECAVNISVPSA